MGIYKLSILVPQAINAPFLYKLTQKAPANARAFDCLLKKLQFQTNTGLNLLVTPFVAIGYIIDIRHTRYVTTINTQRLQIELQACNSGKICQAAESVKCFRSTDATCKIYFVAIR